MIPTMAADRRIPKDRFEASLYADLISKTMDGWKTLDGNIIESPSLFDDGLFRFAVSPRQESFNPFTLMDSPFVDGYIWIEVVSDRGDYHICWSIDGQANWDFAPVIEWDKVTK